MISATGRFWLCPQCQKHVPMRQDVCTCGFNPTVSGVTRREVATGASAPATTEDAAGLPWVWLLGGAAGVLIAVWIAISNMRAEEGHTWIRERIARSRQAPPPPQMPQFVVIDRSTAGKSTAPADVSSAAVPAISVPILDLPQEPLPNSAVTQAPPDTIVQESETDRRRRLGIEDFVRSVAALSAKADQADVAWARYSQACRLNVISVSTSSLAATGAGDRDWFVVAAAASTTTVTVSEWTAACSQIGDFLALSAQVHDGMCDADDRARMNNIYPGTRRDIRTRYRLEWYGWDHYCSNHR